jgi:hypothetical protein
LGGKSEYKLLVEEPVVLLLFFNINILIFGTPVAFISANGQEQDGLLPQPSNTLNKI